MSSLVVFYIKQSLIIFQYPVSHPDTFLVIYSIKLQGVTHPDTFLVIYSIKLQGVTHPDTFLVIYNIKLQGVTSSFHMIPPTLMKIFSKRFPQMHFSDQRITIPDTLAHITSEKLNLPII